MTPLAAWIRRILSSRKSSMSDYMDWLVYAMLSACTLLMIVFVYLSLEWRLQHDSANMYYLTSLMDRFGYVPYRDFFDFQMPGAYFAYLSLIKVFGYDDLGFRIADIVFMSLILGTTWLIMKRFGRLVAAAGVILFGLRYISFGPSYSMQREYLLLLPLLAAVYVSNQVDSGGRRRKQLLTGILLGVAATIKPHVMVAFPVFILSEAYVLYSEENTHNFKPFNHLVNPGILLLIGFCVPFMLILAYMSLTGSLSQFLEIATNYWPLYNDLNGQHQTRSGLISSLLYLYEGYRRMNGLTIWLVSGALGAYIALFQTTFNTLQKRQVLQFIGLAMAFSLYPVLAGKFWNYHWLLFLFFAIELSALCVIRQIPHTPGMKRLFALSLLILVIIIAMRPSDIHINQILGHALPPPAQGRVDEIAAVLNRELGPEDTVQPLDWTGGTLHAMLLANARPATRFVYDFYFYHHISKAYIQGLRSQFIEALQDSRPRFIVEVYDDTKPWVRGQDTTREFPALKNLLAQHYRVMTEGRGYRIYVTLGEQPRNSSLLSEDGHWHPPKLLFRPDA